MTRIMLAYAFFLNTNNTNDTNNARLRFFLNTNFTNFTNRAACAAMESKLKGFA